MGSRHGGQAVKIGSTNGYKKQWIFDLGYGRIGGVSLWIHTESENDGEERWN